MSRNLILVRALWDEEAQVWTAASDDVPGLVTECATLEGLRSKILVMIPELLDANGIGSNLAEIPVHILAEQTAQAGIDHKF